MNLGLVVSRALALALILAFMPGCMGILTKHGRQAAKDAKEQALRAEKAADRAEWAADRIERLMGPADDKPAEKKRR